MLEQLDLSKEILENHVAQIIPTIQEQFSPGECRLEFGGVYPHHFDIIVFRGRWQAAQIPWEIMDDPDSLEEILVRVRAAVSMLSQTGTEEDMDS